MARTRTEYGPPTSRPCTRNSPVARVRVLLAYPVLRFTTSTSTSARGCPCWSVTLPVTAPVVTPCAPTTSATSTANAAAAARARDERTIQCMVGSLLLEAWLGGRLLIEIGEADPRSGPRQARGSALRGRLPEQVDRCATEHEIREPGRERGRQHPPGPHRLAELEHQEVDERGREAHGHAPGGAALRRGDRERRAEQRDDDAREGDRQLERVLHLQLARVGAGTRQRVDVAPQLRVAHFVWRFGLGQEVDGPLAQRGGAQRVEAEGRLAVGADQVAQ